MWSIAECLHLTNRPKWEAQNTCMTEHGELWRTGLLFCKPANWGKGKKTHWACWEGLQLVGTFGSCDLVPTFLFALGEPLPVPHVTLEAKQILISLKLEEKKTKVGQTPPRTTLREEVLICTQPWVLIFFRQGSIVPQNRWSLSSA